MADSLLTDLASWWSLDEASGQRADSHGHNHLSQQGAVGSAAGKIGGAALFGGTAGQSLSVADNSTLHATANGLTIACWVYVSTASGSVVAKDASGARECSLDFSSGRFRWGLFQGNTFAAATDASPAPLNQWVHIVGDWEPTSQRGHLYVNNVLASTTVLTFTQNTSGSANFKIGNRDFADNPFHGLVDEAAIWQRSLTADERARIYNDGNGLTYKDFAPTGPVLRSPCALNYLDTGRILSSPHLIGSL